MSPTRRLRVGVIGLGEIAQIMHLPYLRELEERYEIAAICDISPQLVARIGDLYGVDHRYTDFRALVAQPDLDADVIGPVRHSSDPARALSEASTACSTSAAMTSRLSSRVSTITSASA